MASTTSGWESRMSVTILLAPRPGLDGLAGAVRSLDVGEVEVLRSLLF